MPVYLVLKLSCCACAVISLINMLVFLLPPAAGEKISLGAVNFFLLCIYLLYFQAKIPPLGDHLPLIGKFILYADTLDHSIRSLISAWKT